MKKYFLPLFVMALLAVGFSSCKPDEEIYNPSCKISKIWYPSESGDPNEVYIYNEKTKDLEKIVVDSVYSFDFTTNKDHTVSKIVHVGEKFTEEIALQYTNRLVDKMTYSMDGEVRLEYTFHRIDNKKDKAYSRIDSIEAMYDIQFFSDHFVNPKGNSDHPLFDKFIGNFDEIAELCRGSHSKALTTLYSVKRVTYAPGKHKKYENIAQYEEVIPTQNTKVTHTFEYDESVYNPYYGLSYAYAGMAGYYKNFKTVEQIEKNVAGSISTVVIGYECKLMNEKGFPRHFVTKSSENNIPRNTFILYKK